MLQDIRPKARFYLAAVSGTNLNDTAQGERAPGLHNAIVPRVTALIGLQQTGIPRLQRLPATITRRTIPPSKLRSISRRNCIEVGSEERPMSTFTDTEIDYLKSQRLGRLATVGPDGQPHGVPAGFRYNPKEDRSISAVLAGLPSARSTGMLSRIRAWLSSSTMCRQSIHWTLRGIEIRGQAQVLTS